MPWIIFIGGNLSGLSIEQNFKSYDLVWVLPAGALITLVLNMAGQSTTVTRRIAGAVPFAILLYSWVKFGGDLFQILSWGGWVALAAGIALIVTPSAATSQPKA